MGTMLLTPRQREARKLLGGPQRHTLLVGGSRSGKTSILTYSVLMRAVRTPGSRHVILRRHGNAARNSIWLDSLPKIRQLAFPTIKLTPHERDGYMSLSNGSEIWVGGLDDKERVEKILGNEYATMYFNECSQIEWSSRLTALTRLAQNIEGLKQRAYYDLNPGGTGHWSYQQFVAGLIPGTRLPLADPENYAHMYLNPRDNEANLSADYIRDLENLPAKQRKRFLDGVYNAEVPGALWTYEMIQPHRLVAMQDVRFDLIVRIVIGIDPAVSSNEDSDETGIVVCGLTRSGHIVVLEDLSGTYTALEWAHAAQLPLLLCCADATGGKLPRAGASKQDPALTWTNLSRFAKKLRLPVFAVDGEDAVAVYRVMQESVIRARDGALGVRSLRVGHDADGGGPAVLWAVLSPQPPTGLQRPLARLRSYLESRRISLRR